MEPIIRKSVSDQVVDQIKLLIQSGEFHIGDRFLTEQKLCELLNVSRTTVRESLRILKAMGYIDIIAGKGAFVKKITDRVENDYLDWFAKKGIQYTDFLEVRMILEPWAAKLAAERAQDKDIELLHKIYDRFVAAFNEKDHIGLVECDEQFHTQIFKMSKNPLLISMNDKIAEYFTEFRVKVYNEESGVSNAIEPHKRILEALEKRNPAEAEAEMQKHIKEIRRDINSALNKTQ